MPRRTLRTVSTVALLAATTALLAAAPAALATFPAHNGLLAFHSQTDAGTQIFTVRPNGNDLRQITHVAGDAIRADWSPDGRRIAFEIDTADTASVAIMNADGSGLVVLPPPPGGLEFDPSFTPDGARLVFERFVPDTNDDAIWSMKLDGSDRRPITSGSGGGTDPNVSPDGHALSFVAFNGLDFGSALVVSGIDGSRPLQLTPFSSNVGDKQDWAPDGQRLAFIRNADLPNGSSANIATIRPDGTDLRLLTSFQGGEVSAFVGTYSPDGRWIVFRLEDHGRFGLFKMRPDGSHLKAILPLSDFAARFIDWGPRAGDRGGDGNEDDDS